MDQLELGYTLIPRHSAEAVGYLRAAIAIRSDIAAAEYDLGVPLLNSGQSDTAIHHFERVIEMVPDHMESRIGKATALLTLKRPDEAIKQLRDVLRIQPNMQAAHWTLGYAFAMKDQSAEAAQEYREAIRIGPDSAELRNNLANTLYEQDDLDGASLEYAESLRLDIRASKTHVNYAALLAEMGRYREAVEQYRVVVAQYPTSSEYRNNLRAVRIRLGEPDAVRAEWQRELAAEPPEHDAWDGYAELCLFLGATNEYHRTCRALLARFGDNTSLPIAERTSRACLLAPLGKEELEGAVALIDRALAADKPSNEKWMEPYLLFVKGLAEFRQDHLQSAIAIMKGPASEILRPAPLLVIAMAQHRLGQETQARQTLAAAVATYDWRPANADIRDAWICHLLRREAEAMILPDLPGFFEGKYEPGDIQERMAFQGACQSQRRTVASARLFSQMFAEVPGLASKPDLNLGYRAACAAALAGTGVGSDAAKLSAEERAAWREQARQWLLGDIREMRKKVDHDAARADVRKALIRWYAEPDLAGLREKAGLDKLPGEEQKRFADLWAEFQDLRQAAAKAN